MAPRSDSFNLCSRPFSVNFNFLPEREREMAGEQLMRRIPRIKFPQRHPKPSGAASTAQPISATTDVDQGFFLKSTASKSQGGKASLQPKRMAVSEEEIEAILMGGCY